MATSPEADVDVADSWEDADTEDLERRMEERKVELVVPSSSKLSSERAKQPAQSDEVEMVVGCVDPRLRIQDSERTEYVAPVKILKREGGQTMEAQDPRPKVEEQKQVMSLAEREEAYASARARIMGTQGLSGKQGGGTQQKSIVSVKTSDSLPSS